jgi:hypothetical protein
MVDVTIWRLLGLWTATSVPVSLLVGGLLARQGDALVAARRPARLPATHPVAARRSA